MTWMSTARFLRKETLSLVKRGPTQEEAQAEKARRALAPKAKPVDQVAADAEAANVIRST